MRIMFREKSVILYVILLSIEDGVMQGKVGKIAGKGCVNSLKGIPRKNYPNKLFSQR
jgi:hypothetical protein